MVGCLERIYLFWVIIKSLMEEKNMGGRPRLTPEQITERKLRLLRKIEPYLKSGLSVSKSLHETKIFNSEFYKFMAQDEFFKDEVSRYRQYPSVLANQIIVTELFRIVEKQNGRETTQPLSKDDHKFLWWFVKHSNLCKEEWGRHKNAKSFDPEVEIQKIRSMLD